MSKPAIPQVTEAEVKSFFHTFEPRIEEAVRGAEEIWQEVCEKVPAAKKGVRSRGRNSFFSDLVAEQVWSKFFGDPDAKPVERYGSTALHVKGRFDVRFKKVDEKCRSRSYRTPRNKKYESQLPLYGEHLESAIRLTIGWCWNAAATAIPKLSMILPYKYKAVWNYEILPQINEGQNPITISPQSPPKPARFRSKSVDEGKTGNKESA